MKPLLLAPALALCLSGCAPLLGMMAGAGPPPQAPAQVTKISRTGIDFALNSFDAVLYGLDFAMDAKKIIPGSDRAKQLASIGRKIMGSLEVADSALKLGNSATYEDAFGNAKSLLEQFRALLPTSASSADRPPLTNAQRLAILDRLDRASVTIA
jgi:hypothetical protein